MVPGRKNTILAAVIVWLLATNELAIGAALARGPDRDAKQSNLTASATLAARQVEERPPDVQESWMRQNRTSWCCVEAERKEEVWLREVVNFFTDGWGNEPDGCHKGTMDNLWHQCVWEYASNHPLWRCRTDWLYEEHDGAFGQITITHHDCLERALFAASPAENRDVIDCSIGCKTDQMWNWKPYTWPEYAKDHDGNDVWVSRCQTPGCDTAWGNLADVL